MNERTDNSDKEEENTSNSGIKEEVYEEGDRIKEDSSNETDNQVDVGNNENQEHGIPVGNAENEDNNQENDLVHQDIKRLNNEISRPKFNVNM